MAHAADTRPRSRLRTFLVAVGVAVVVSGFAAFYVAIRKAQIDCGPPRAYIASLGSTGEAAYLAAQRDYGDATARKCFASAPRRPR